MAKAFQASMSNRCESFGPMNYIMLGKFVTAFSKDQAEKKLLMRHLALGIAERKDNFYDLDGESGRLGMIETLERKIRSTKYEV